MLIKHIKPHKQSHSLFNSWLPRLIMTIGCCIAASHCTLAADPDKAAITARGIRIISGKHLELLTDVPSKQEIDSLPSLFDAAVPEWRKIYGVTETATAEWRVRGFLMRDRKVFESLELLPSDLPDFPNGYALGRQLFLHDQSSDYYRRHLLLHEGTHLFQFNILKWNTPQWFSEATAEMIGTHSVKDDGIRLATFPLRAADYSKWGRIELLQMSHREGTLPRIGDLFQLQGRDYANNVSYSWCWGLGSLLQQHPSYRERFAKLLKSHSDGRNFAETWQELFGAETAILQLDYDSWVGDAVYGCEWDQLAVRYKFGREFPATVNTARVQVDSRNGWQSTGVRVTEGMSLHIRAGGTALMKMTPEKWPATADGITLRYHRGLPLGTLLGAIVEDRIIDGNNRWFAPERHTREATFLYPQRLATETRWKVPRGGVIFLKINDSPAELSENRDGFTVEISRIQQ